MATRYFHWDVGGWHWRRLWAASVLSLRVTCREEHWRVKALASGTRR